MTSEVAELSLPEEQAFQLTRCAIALGNAWEKVKADPADLVVALNANLENWIAVRSWCMRSDCMLPDKTKMNLRRLSEFVATKTFLGVDGMTEEVVKSLININLQISEGILEGQGA